MNARRRVPIAVTMRVVDSSPDAERRDAISHDWMRWLSRFALIPVCVPNGVADPIRFLRDLDVCGMLLTSGNDVGPQPGEPWRGSASVAEMRDQTERALLDYAVEQRMPAMGVCRGMQFINCYFGGTLVRDLSTWARDEAHVAAHHRVKIVDAAFQQRLGVEACSTNSFHNHGVTLKTLAPSLRALALSEASVVEGLAHATFPILGIQWHPERSGPEDPGVGEELFRQWLAWCEGYAMSCQVPT